MKGCWEAFSIGKWLSRNSWSKAPRKVSRSEQEVSNANGGGVESLTRAILTLPKDEISRTQGVDGGHNHEEPQEEPTKCRRSRSSNDSHTSDLAPFAQLTQRGVWTGGCLSRENGKRHFGGFVKNGQRFALNDCVYVRSDQKDRIWLMKILRLWEEESWMPTTGSLALCLHAQGSRCRLHSSDVLGQPTWRIVQAFRAISRTNLHSGRH